MKIKCMGCEALARLLYHGAAISPHTIDIKLFKLGLHNEPEKLRETLQQEIDETNSTDYKSIVLAYGLCGKATAGLQAKGAPLVIPKAHDCITLFLGSREKYKAQFENFPSTYWYAVDYIERQESSDNIFVLGADSSLNIEGVYQEYVEKYGKDNAQYLMEVMGAWQANYNRAVFIDMGIGNGKNVENSAKEEAQKRGWTFEKLAGDLILIRRLLFGDWQQDFLIVPPGQKISMTVNDDIMECIDGNNT